METTSTPIDITQLSFSEALAAPFLSAAQTNNELAMEQLRFLIDNGFTENGQVFMPKMIKLMVITKGALPSSATNQSEAIIEIPILTLLPFTSMLIEEVEVEFSFSVNAVSEAMQSQDNKSNYQPGLFKNLMGRISGGNQQPVTTQDGQTKLSASPADNGLSTINVKASSAVVPLPNGFCTLLNALSNSIGTLSEQRQ